MEPGFTRIIHPGLGPSSVSEVPESSLPQWHQSGWRRLAEGDIPPAAAEPEPPPVTLAEVTADHATEEK